MQITIKVIPHKEQRYDTTDDWLVDETGDITLFVSEAETTEVYKEIIHGLTECFLCLKHGITQQQVDEYDLAHPETDNPGEEVTAPYHWEHKVANTAESLMDL